MAGEVDNREALIRFVDEANDKIWNLMTAPKGFDPETVVREILDKAETAGYAFGKAWGLLNLGRGLFIIKHDPVASLETIDQTLRLFREMDNKKWVANTYLIQAIINNTIGNREAALYGALRGIDYYQSNPHDQSDRAMAFYVAGTVYKDLGRFAESEKHYREGLASSDPRSKNWIGRMQTSLSGIYTSQGKYQEALALSLEALRDLRAEGNVIAESRALTDIGVIQKKVKDYDAALRSLTAGLVIREEQGMKHFTLTSLLEIADLYTETNRVGEAVATLLKAEAIAIGINLPARLGVIYKALALAYKQAAEFERALFYYEKFLTITLDLTRNDSEKRINELHNDLLQEKEQEIERLKNVELKHAYQIISEKQKEILDSIQYAKRIQQSLLPNEKMISSLISRASKKS